MQTGDWAIAQEPLYVSGVAVKKEHLRLLSFDLLSIPVNIAGSIGSTNEMRPGEGISLLLYTLYLVSVKWNGVKLSQKERNERKMQERSN